VKIYILVQNLYACGREYLLHFFWLYLIIIYHFSISGVYTPMNQRVFSCIDSFYDEYLIKHDIILKKVSLPTFGSKQQTDQSILVALQSIIIYTKVTFLKNRVITHSIIFSTEITLYKAS